MWKYLLKVFGGENVFIFFLVWIITPQITQQPTTNLLHHPYGKYLECNLARGFFFLFYITATSFLLTPTLLHLKMESPHGCRILMNADMANDRERIQVESNTLLSALSS